MIDLHFARLPTNIELLATVHLKFNNICLRTRSGREIRNMINAVPERIYDLNNCKLSRTGFDIFSNFFQSRCGIKYSFLLKDWSDFQVNKQKIIPDSCVDNILNLEKIYNDPVKPYHRPILMSAIGSVKIYQDDQPVENQYFKQMYAQVKLHPSLLEKDNLTISFDFYVPVRFYQDNLSYKFNQDGTISLIDTKLIEVYD